MKKIILLLIVSFFCLSMQSQKKKVAPKKSASIVLAKVANLSAEIVKNNFFSCKQRYNESTIVLKTVDVVLVYSQIYEIKSKTLALGNIQKTTNITRKVFLDKLKNTSETQEKNEKGRF